MLPTLWFRNTWSWSAATAAARRCEQLAAGDGHRRRRRRRIDELGERYLYCEGDAALLFTENETNNERLFGTPNATPYVKDGINDFVVHGQQDAVNPDADGHQGAAHYRLQRRARARRRCIRLRLSDRRAGRSAAPFGTRFDETSGDRAGARPTSSTRRSPRPRSTEDEARVMRQALAGMLWTQAVLLLRRRQVARGARRRSVRARQARAIAQPRLVPHGQRRHHLDARQVGVPLVRGLGPRLPLRRALRAVDPDFAKQQLDLMLRELYLHPNGQIPAYEWNFGDVNPPVHAWADALPLPTRSRRCAARGTSTSSSAPSSKLLLNFTWWVNRKDRFGKNVFEGGFLGLDNIGVFDRSAAAAHRRLPRAGRRHRLDGALLPEHAGDRRRARRRTTRSTRTWR